jgi:dTDP-4-amino-4,6-dideoxygalactose transaminase
MSIPFLDLKRQHTEIEAEAIDAITRVIRNGVFILGPEVVAFEIEWAQFCGTSGAAAVGSGTDALTLGLIASGAVRPGRGDEVITSPLTAGYTALAILNAGGVPIFGDIDPQTYALNPETLQTAITKRTRAILPVHLYGQMADMPAIRSVAAFHGLAIIEDGAQAHGARLGSEPAGTQSQAVAFSFYPTKNLGACGDGGAVVSNDQALIENVKLLREGGHPAALQGEIKGCNSRLDEMQAALLRVKLRHLDQWNLQRRRLAGIYDQHFESARHLRAPAMRAPGAHVHHLYVVQHADRDGLRAHLSGRGIETMIHYPFLLHQQRLFQSVNQPVLPVAEYVGKLLLSLPLYPQLSDDEVREVAAAVLEFG